MKNIGFIGGGNMASAIINGLLKADNEVKISVADINPETREIHNKNGHFTTDKISEVLANSKTIILAVKPQVAEIVLAEIAKDITKEHLLISILAGTTIDSLESLLPEQTKVIRTMPNTPMAIGEGMVGMSAGTHAKEEDLENAKKILGTSAKVLIIPEEKMNAITAVAGSGPAYYFLFCEAMEKAAESLGFTKEEAALITKQTAYGSINYLCDKEGFPAAELRKQVTSPGGTTAAGIAVFEKTLLETAKEAAKAAENRGIELGNK